MPAHIVIDHTGDSRHVFDRNDTVALMKAEERFKDLTSRGFTAAVREGDGQSRLIKAFDSTAEETLFFPRLVGG